MPTLKELMGDKTRGDGRKFYRKDIMPIINQWFEPIFLGSLRFWYGVDEKGNGMVFKDDEKNWEELTPPKKTKEEAIEVGYAYKTLPKCGETSVIHIFHKMPSGERPYVGLRDDGMIIKFDRLGRDEWYECGGYWNELNLSTKFDSKVRLIYRKVVFSESLASDPTSRPVFGFPVLL